MGFQLHVDKMGDVLVLTAAGRLTLPDGHTKVRDAIHVFTEQGARKFLLDFAQVQFIDSFGIGELARVYSIVRRAGGDMKLSGANSLIAEVLAVSRLNTIFEMHPTQHSAIRAFTKGTAAGTA